MIQRRAKPPWQVFPGIFSSIDSYSKKVVHGHFDRAGRRTRCSGAPTAREGGTDCARLDAIRGCSAMRGS